MSNAQTRSSYASSERIVFLDYLRIIAFLSVLIGHQYYDTLAKISTDASYHVSIRTLLTYVCMPLSFGGGAGVIIFFLVSGYIITEILRKETTLPFVIRRIFRIYPLYIVAVLIELAIQTSRGNSPCISVLLPRLLLIGDFFKTPYALNGVEWTLRAEILFYALMALITATKVFQNKKLLFMVMVILTILMAYFYPFPRKLFKGYTFLFMPFLFAGTAMNLYKHREISGFWTLGLFSLVLFLFSYLYPIDHNNLAQSYFQFSGCAIFLLFYFFNEKLKPSRFVRFISDFTYPIYLFHNFMIFFIEQQLATILISFPLRLTAFVGFILFIFTLHFFIEKPGIRFGYKLSHKFKRPIKESLTV